MNVKISQFSINQASKSFFAILKQPQPSGWTLPMTWVLCILPVFLLLLHPFDAQVSAAWTVHTTKFQQILAASTNMIKSGYWVVIALLVWFTCTFYLKRYAQRAELHFIKHVREAAIYLFFAILSAGIPVTIIKYLVGRARPPLLERFGVAYFSPLHGAHLYLSFPSGHAMMAGILMVVSFKFLPRLRWLFMPLCVVLAFSRVVVAAHYPTDVVAGFTIGAVVSLWLYNFLSLRNIISRA